jgi:ammonia channel protein AmtB
MILFLAFAVACTAGILYPLDWIIGIRLAKEDELAGLDLAGMIRSFCH